MTGAKRDLFSLREELVDNAIEDQFANLLERYKFLWPDLGGIQYVKVEIVLFRLRDCLNGELPLWVRPILDGLIQVLAMKVGILAVDLEGFVPYETVHA